MSATLEYREPHLFTAGMLALLVHLAFFTPLYMATRWQSKPPEEFMVQIWDGLPDTEVASEQTAPARMELKQPAKVTAPVSPPVKSDIELRDKKNKKLSNKEKAKAAARQEAEERELEAYDRRTSAAKAQQLQAVQQQVRAEVRKANQVQVERYEDLIRNKIRRKMKLVADVPESAEAIFKVTLLPDGMLMDDPELVKGSGNAAYDDAAARAIRSAEPLPVPTDPSLQMMFRELKLSIRP
jgi:colicin import membrane protein